MLDLKALSTPPVSYDLASHPLPPLPIGPSLADWQRQREALLAAWRGYLGHGPEQVELAPRSGSSESVGDVTRTLVSYDVEPGCRAQAYLLKPPGRGPFPAVVVFHPSGEHTFLRPAGLAGSAHMQFGLRLAERGYVALCPRNFLWDYRGHPCSHPDFAADLIANALLARYPQWTGMGKMLWDGLRAADYLLTLPEVDPQRLGCLGHSLGGKQALYSTVFDERMKAGVACEGGVGLPFTNWDAPWYLGEGIKSRPDLEHHQLLALAAPRPLLVLGGGLQPSAADARPGGAADGIQDWSYVEAARPAYALHKAADRLGLLLHNHGHTLPPEAEEALYGWFERFLSCPLRRT